jgi:hypothetical protein
MSLPTNDFFKRERARFFQPDPFFYQRVLARLHEPRTTPSGIWEAVPASCRPVLALVAVLFLAFLAARLFTPVVPEHSFVASVEAEQIQGEEFVYSGESPPADRDLLNQIMGGGSQ